ncbi:hypothetical protein E1261_42460, partial [Kribbella albertanoniae]
MSKFLGFLLGVAVALAGPAVFGVLSAPGGIQLNTKGMTLAYAVGALVFWAVVSYFSGAGAIGAFLAFGTLVYCWLWIPNRTTNFLDDVPGVTTGMVEGTRQYTLNGVVPILTVISLVYAIQLIVRSVQRRRLARAEAERLQREQEAAQAQQEAAAAAVYPVAASNYPAESYGGAGYAAPSYEPSNRYDDLFDEPERPRNQADEQTVQFPVAEPAPERTAAFPVVGNEVAYSNDETVLVPNDRDETVVAPTPESGTESGGDEVTVIASEDDADATVAATAIEQTAVAEEEARNATQHAPEAEPVAAAPEAVAPEVVAPEAEAPVAAAPEASAPAAPTPETDAPVASTPVASAPAAPAPVAEKPAPQAEAPGGSEDDRSDGPTNGGPGGFQAVPPPPSAPAAEEKPAGGGGPEKGQRSGGV